MKLKDKDFILADRHSDTTFTDCLVIESTNKYSSLDIKKYILKLQEENKAIRSFSNGQTKVIRKYNDFYENLLNKIKEFRL